MNRALLKRLPADAEGAFDGKRPPLFAAPNFERTLKFYNLPPELVALKGLGMFAMVKKAREWFEQRGHDMKGDPTPERFHDLLWIEELKMLFDMTVYDIYLETALAYDGRRELYTIEVSNFRQQYFSALGYIPRFHRLM